MEPALRAWDSSSRKVVLVGCPGPVEDDWARVVSSLLVSTFRDIHMRLISFGDTRVRRSLISICILAVSACTTYTPVRVADMSPGYNVRVSLSDQGAVDLAPKIGARARQLEGTLTQASDSMIIMSVRRVVREGGGDDTYNDIPISLPSRDVESVERSTTSVSRSVLTAGAIVGTALLAARGAGDLSGGKDGGKPSPGN